MNHIKVQFDRNWTKINIRALFILVASTLLMCFSGLDWIENRVEETCGDCECV